MPAEIPDLGQHFVARPWTGLLPVLPWDERPKLLVKLDLLYGTQACRLQASNDERFNCCSPCHAQSLSFLEHWLWYKMSIIMQWTLHAESFISVFNSEDVVLSYCCEHEVVIKCVQQCFVVFEEWILSTDNINIVLDVECRESLGPRVDILLMVISIHLIERVVKCFCVWPQT
jgi:hypothetical protein